LPDGLLSHRVLFPRTRRSDPAQEGRPDRAGIEALSGVKRTSRSILESLKGLAGGARPARVIVTRGVGITQPGRPIRRPQQQQEECPVSLVFGTGSAAVRALHDNLPFSRAHAPPPSPASLLQDHFKNRKLVEHCNRFKVKRGSISVSFHPVVGSKFTARKDKNSTEQATPG